MDLSSAVVLFIIIWFFLLLLFFCMAIDCLKDGLFFTQEHTNKKELFFGILCLIGFVFCILSCIFILFTPIVILLSI